MVFGITGNSDKDKIWEHVPALIRLLSKRNTPFIVQKSIASGLRDRGFTDVAITSDNFSERSDVILSFGGDGTLLNTVHEIGDRGTPVLGVNIGRLGFLATTELQDVEAAIDLLEAGTYDIDRRAMLEIRCTDAESSKKYWGLNEIVITRTGFAGLLTIDIEMDGTFLNSYRSDGVIVATPTGSTAYSLSAGGPILAPGCGSIVITPLAAHSLGERPIVLSNDSVLTIRVADAELPYVFAVDGRSTFVENVDTQISISHAARVANLVRFPNQHFLSTLRSKLKWGSQKERA